MSNHTPGEWRVAESRLDYSFIVDACGRTFDSRMTIAKAVCVGDPMRQSDINETFANAQLIARAPELLAINKTMCRKLGKIEGRLSLMVISATEGEYRSYAAECVTELRRLLANAYEAMRGLIDTTTPDVADGPIHPDQRATDSQA